MRLRFGHCVLDRETRELIVRGEVVRLSPKAFQFLVLLLDSRPRALSKADIHERLWPDTFVTDGTLTSLIAEVRTAIGDDAHLPRFVRTVQRFGYAFSGKAVEEREGKSPAARSPGFAYRLFCGPREIALEDGESVIGRDPGVTVYLDRTSVSRRHARIAIAAGQATIEDLGSKNGTTVEGARIDSPVTLRDGSRFRIGSVEFSFRIFPLSGSTQTESSRT